MLAQQILDVLMTNEDESDVYHRDADYCEISELENGFQIRYGGEYSAPALNFAKLMGLSQLFGTLQIDVDNYSRRGCESCDWGSDYGHEIQIIEPTKNKVEMAALVGKDLFKKEKK